MNRGGQQSPRRSTKFVYGDHITRSEYNDGVLRNNHRANNRLSREMQMYEKAQKVVMKDLGKETQLLRAKLTTTGGASPRMTLTKNTNAVIEPFTVFGTSANPSRKRGKTNTPGQSHISSTAEQSTPSMRLTNKNGQQKRNSALEASLADLRNGSLDSRISFTDSKAGESVNRVETSSRNSALSSLKTTAKPSKSSTTKSVPTSKVAASTKPASIKTDTNEPRGGRTSAFSDLSRMHLSPPGSRISFIDILAEAEERKARQRSENHTLRPRSPQLMSELSNGDVHGYHAQRRSSHHNATPTATHVTSHMN